MKTHSTETKLNALGSLDKDGSLEKPFSQWVTTEE